jgi:galacturan 1,4-alpha-galacturonidase
MQWFNIIANSSDILISNMDLEAKSTDGGKIANSDGWDTYRSDRIVIQDSVIVNTDGEISKTVVPRQFANGSSRLRVIQAK